MENTQFLQPSDLNPSASDRKALSLPSFTVTQTLVNLLADGGGTCELFYLTCFHLGAVGIKPKTNSNRGDAQRFKPITGDVGIPYFPVYKSTFQDLKISPKIRPRLIHGSKLEIQAPVK